jgi:hypothetical protein
VTKYSGVGTTHIGVRQATGVYHATRFSAARQQSINLGVDINWDRLGVDDTTASTIFRELKRRVARRWAHLRKTSCPELEPLTYVGTHENPEGKRNTHWCAYVAPGFQSEFRRTVEERLKKLTGVENLGRALRFKRIATAGTHNKYILKGVNPAYARYFHMRAVDQGFVGGRGRVFISRTIGWTARQTAGWRP